jgi:hypothetical protein
VGTGNFSLHHRVQNGSGAHPASYPIGTRGSFLVVKRPGRDADHSLPSTAEVKECVELYLHSTNTPSWRGAQGTGTGTLPINESEINDRRKIPKHSFGYCVIPYLSTSYLRHLCPEVSGLYHTRLNHSTLSHCNYKYCKCLDYRPKNRAEEVGSTKR